MTGPAARTHAPPPLTPSTRAPTALDESDDVELKAHVSLSSSGARGGRGDSGYRRLKLLLLLSVFALPYSHFSFPSLK